MGHAKPVQEDGVLATWTVKQCDDSETLKRKPKSKLDDAWCSRAGNSPQCVRRGQRCIGVTQIDTVWKVERFEAKLHFRLLGEELHREILEQAKIPADRTWAGQSEGST